MTLDRRAIAIKIALGLASDTGFGDRDDAAMKRLVDFIEKALPEYERQAREGTFKHRTKHRCRKRF